jgi:hypothetical protein
MNTALVTPRGPGSVRARHRRVADRRPGGPVRIRLWIPLTALIVLLSPLLLLATTMAALHPRLRRLRAHRLIPVLAMILSNIGGTLIEVEAPGASIRLRIF